MIATVYSIDTLQLYAYTPYSPTVFLLYCILHVNGPSCINLLFPAVRSRFCIMIYLGMPSSTVCAEISAVCKFRGFRGHLLISENLIRENLLVCNNWRFVTIHDMLPFHDEPVIRENTIAKIMFASCSAKISYRENFRVYGINYITLTTTVNYLYMYSNTYSM